MDESGSILHVSDSACAANCAVFIVVLTCAWVVSAQAQSCDCSCESFTRLTSKVQEFKAAQDAGQPQPIPPELMTMGQCASQCAMEWAQCADPALDTDRLKRARESAQDYNADNAAGRERAIDERSIGETEKNLQGNPGLARELLTAAYLKGTWCSLYGGQESTLWQFDANGNYRIGIPAGSGFALQPNEYDLENFNSRFEKLLEHGEDTFTTVHEHGRKNVFKRGPCN